MSPPVPGEGRFLLSVPFAGHGVVTRMQISNPSPAPEIHELLGELSRLSVVERSPSYVAPLDEPRPILLTNFRQSSGYIERWE
jgi:hypothetical protein